MADWHAAAEPARREALLETAAQERNAAWWADMHGKLLFALVTRHQGESQDTCDFVEGLLNDWTPASAVRFFGNDDPIAHAPQFCILPDEDGLKPVAPQVSKLSSPIVWILVSDSSLALITGKGRALQKYDHAEHFHNRRPEYVTEWVHEMMWRKTLNALVKRAMELIEAARQKHGASCHINVHISWFGNELRRRQWHCTEPKLALYERIASDILGGSRENAMNWVCNRQVSRPRLILPTMVFMPFLTSFMRHWGLNLPTRSSCRMARQIPDSVGSRPLGTQAIWNLKTAGISLIARKTGRGWHRTGPPPCSCLTWFGRSAK